MEESNHVTIENNNIEEQVENERINLYTTEGLLFLKIVVTVWIIFSEDIRQSCFHSQADYGFLIITSIIFFGFLLEWLQPRTSIVEGTLRFKLFGYKDLTDYNFMVDFFNLCSIICDVSCIYTSAHRF